MPLVEIADRVKRPPILSYAPYTLANWRKIGPDGEMVVENLELLHKFIHKKDAAWFTLIHVEIEAKAAPAIQAIAEIEEAILQKNDDAILEGLVKIHDSLIAMMQTLKRMPEHCHPTVYYNEVRPYIFSFEGCGVRRGREIQESATIICRGDRRTEFDYSGDCTFDGTCS